NTGPLRVFDAGQALVQAFENDAGARNVAPPTAAMIVGRTYHVVFRIVTGVVSCYLDGSSVAVTQSAPGVLWPAVVNFSYAFNNGTTDDDNPWRGGLVDELALYGVALSPAQILAHFHAAANPPGGVTTIAVSATDGSGMDVTPLISGLVTGDRVNMNVEWMPAYVTTCIVTFRLTGAPVAHGGWWELPVIAEAAQDAFQEYFFLNGQMIVASHTVPAGALAVGDLLTTTQPYQLLAAG